MMKNRDLGLISIGIVVFLSSLIVLPLFWFPVLQEASIQMYDENNKKNFSMTVQSNDNIYIDQAKLGSTNVLSYVNEYDNAWVTYNKGVKLFFSLTENLSDGDSIWINARLNSLIPYPFIYIVNNSNPNQIFATYEFTNTSWHWIEFVLNMDGSWGDFELILDHRFPMSRKLSVNVIMGNHNYNTHAAWHDYLGNIITSFNLTFTYNIIVGDTVNQSNVWVDLTLQSNYYYQNNTPWYQDITTNIINSVAIGSPVLWTITNITLPPPPLNSTQITLSFTVIATVHATIINGTWISDHQVFPNLRTLTFYWY